MTRDKRSVYGTLESEPDDRAGVEVGGGDKAAAAVDRAAREEAEPGREPKKRRDGAKPKPEGEEKARSPT